MQSRICISPLFDSSIPLCNPKEEIKRAPMPIFLLEPYVHLHPDFNVYDNKLADIFLPN
jgi:hypothetical protein